MVALLNLQTRIVVQGITGREGTTLVQQSLGYFKTQIVAGVTPGKGGSHVFGVPVYDSLRQALRENDANTTVICVPPTSAYDAAMEAIDNQIPLIVIITERIPRRDVAEFIAFAKKKNVKIIGPNSMGLIAPGLIKVGLVGGPVEDVDKSYTKGHVAILSRSGGMTTELASMLTQSGIGQSICVSIGGDPIVGSTFVDLMPLLADDLETKAVVIYGEPGGIQEEALADYIASKHMLLPVLAYIGGKFVDLMPGQRFGHAGVFVEGEFGSTSGKIKKMSQAGVLIPKTLSELPEMVLQVIHPTNG